MSWGIKLLDQLPLTAEQGFLAQHVQNRLLSFRPPFWVAVSVVLLAQAIEQAQNVVDVDLVPLGIGKEFFGVDPCDLFIDKGAVFVFEDAPIFDGEFQHVVVGNGVGDDIAVELFVE